MFKGNFKEATTQSANFPEDSPAAFGLLLRWAYFGKVPALCVEAVEDGVCRLSWPATRFYALAEKLYMPSLQNSIMDEVMGYYGKADSLPSTTTMCLMYELCPAQSPMRTFATRAFYFLIMHRHDKAMQQMWPLLELHRAMMKHPDLAFDFLELLREGTIPQVPDELDFCTFHVHGDGKSCSSGSSGNPIHLL